MRRAHRSTHKTWLPETAELSSFLGTTRRGDTSQAEASTAAAVEQLADAVESDDLDKLLASYEAKAAADLEAVQQPLSHGQQQQKGMRQLRDEGLATAIPADNKGFKLLANMGYRVGEGLGKNKCGRISPLDVVVKADRRGLGVAELKKRKQEEAQEKRRAAESKRQRNLQESQQQYMRSQAEEYEDRRTAGLLVAARRACEDLDRRSGLGQNNFWLPEKPPEEDGENEESSTQAGEEADPDCWENLPVSQRLQDVVAYLRLQHCYCLFCGTKYDNQQDLSQHCPGPEEDLH